MGNQASQIVRECDILKDSNEEFYTKIKKLIALCETQFNIVTKEIKDMERKGRKTVQQVQYDIDIAKIELQTQIIDAKSIVSNSVKNACQSEEIQKQIETQMLKIKEDMIDRLEEIIKHRIEHEMAKKEPEWKDTVEYFKRFKEWFGADMKDDLSSEDVILTFFVSGDKFEMPLEMAEYFEDSFIGGCAHWYHNTNKTEIKIYRDPGIFRSIFSTLHTIWSKKEHPHVVITGNPRIAEEIDYYMLKNYITVCRH